MARKRSASRIAATPEIIRRRKAGEGVADIAVAVGLCAQTVYRILDEAGLPWPKRKPRKPPLRTPQKRIEDREAALALAFASSLGPRRAGAGQIVHSRGEAVNRRSKLRIEKTPEVVRRYTQDKQSMSDIATATGLSKTTVRNVLLDEGVEIRDPGVPPRPMPGSGA